MDVELDVALTETEQRAIFTLLYEMAQVDGEVASSETGLLRRVHRKFFDEDFDAWEQPEGLAPEAFADDLKRPISRRVLIQLLYAMVQVDGLELDDELAFLAHCARSTGLGDPEVREVWDQVAMAIFERSTRDLVERSLVSLGREVSRLRRGLFLGVEADDTAHAIVRQGIDRFQIP